MNFADFVCSDSIIAELEAKERDGVIAELTTSLEKGGKIPPGSGQKIIKAIIKK